MLLSQVRHQFLDSATGSPVEAGIQVIAGMVNIEGYFE